MPQSQHTQMIQQRPQQSGGGGLLRNLLRPFMPEVSAGIDMASGLLHGNAGSLGQGLSMASKALQGDAASSQESPEMSGAPGEVTPGDMPEVNPVQAQAPIQGDDDGDEMAMTADQGDADGDELTPDQMASLQHLDKQFPGVHQELMQDPGLLDGAGNLVNKLRYMYRKQQGGVQA